MLKLYYQIIATVYEIINEKSTSRTSQGRLIIQTRQCDKRFHSPYKDNGRIRQT